MSKRTESLPRRIVENAAMGGLMAGWRLAHAAGSKVQDLVSWSDRIGRPLRFIPLIRENEDTLARGRALAYRWSRYVPGATCLHRALATRIWLAAFRIDSRVVLGFRQREEFEGHAWLQVDLNDAYTVLFVGDDDDYEVALSG